MQPAATGEPGNAPASNERASSAVVIRPLSSAPILARTCEPGVGPVARNTSPRDMTILTGRPVFFDSSNATGSR